MSTTSKSPRKVALAALRIGERSLPRYAHRCAPKTFTQPQLFACLVLKTFFKTDYRGIICQLQDNPTLCQQMGLKRLPHFTTLQKAAQRLLRYRIAHRLLRCAAQSVLGRRRSLRRTAADASGFEAGQVSPYFVRRRQRGQKQAVNPLFVTTTYTRFPKLNLIGDCQTHLILACHPSRGPTPDGPDLPTLIDRLPAELTIEQLIADAGYDGEHHHRLLREDHGIRSLIPPTIGRPTNKPPTGKYRRLMQRLFRHADRTNYGQRWQSETIFSMIKRNLGCAIHARSYWPQCRELLLLAITHNVMIVMIAKVFYRAMPSCFISNPGSSRT